jgi:5-formyltetrahydrofolate cyclo-ligase
MRSQALKRAKRDVRRAVLAARDAMPAEERDVAGVAVATTLLDAFPVRAGQLVMAYWAFGSEVPTGPLMERVREAGAIVALPRIDGSRLRILAYHPGDRLIATAFGAMEPADGDELDPAAVSLIATPGAAFDPEGRRIGYGGGFYDRLFPQATQAVRVGIAYDLQVLDPPLPEGHIDLRVHAICTPTRTIRAPAPT